LLQYEYSLICNSSKFSAKGVTTHTHCVAVLPGVVALQF
jgi:hypothetical protein